MKTFKKATRLAFAFALFLMGTTAFAQQANSSNPRANLTAEQRAQAQVQRYQKQLDLTPEQTVKITAIVTASVQEMDKLRTPGTRPDRQAMQAEAQKRALEINAILTPAQQEKFAALLAKQMEQGQGRGGRQPIRGTNKTKGDI
jgi:protein CpxP